MARLQQMNANQQPARVAPRPVAVRRFPPVFDRVAQYLREVWAELKRVDWPSRPELIASTIVVIAVLVVLAVYLGLWDLLFSWLFTKVLAH